MYLPCPLVKQKKMQMQSCYSLDATGTMNYVRQKIDKHIENNAFNRAVNAFTSTPPTEILSHNSSLPVLYSSH